MPILARDGADERDEGCVLRGGAHARFDRWNGSRLQGIRGGSFPGAVPEILL